MRAYYFTIIYIYLYIYNIIFLRTQKEVIVICHNCHVTPFFPFAGITSQPFYLHKK